MVYVILDNEEMNLYMLLISYYIFTMLNMYSQELYFINAK